MKLGSFGYWPFRHWAVFGIVPFSKWAVLTPMQRNCAYFSKENSVHRNTETQETPKRKVITETH